MLAYVSFDLGHDAPQLDKFKAGASPDVKVNHWSQEKPEAGPDWQKMRRDQISQSDMLIVLVGTDTSGAPNVQEEIQIAKRANVPYFGIYSEEIVPVTALPQGLAKNRVVKWDWKQIGGAIEQLLGEGKHHQFK